MTRISKKKVFQVLLVGMILGSGSLNVALTTSEKIGYSSYIRPLELASWIDMDNLTIYLEHNFQQGYFREYSENALRPQHDGMRIADYSGSMEEFRLDPRIWSDFIGDTGGIKYTPTGAEEYAHTGYYLLHLGHQLDVSVLIDETLWRSFIFECYNSTSGGFSISPGQSENYFANWMIIYEICDLGQENFFNLSQNLAHFYNQLSFTTPELIWSFLLSQYLVFGENTQDQNDFQAIREYYKERSITYYENLSLFNYGYIIMILNLLGLSDPTNPETPISTELKMQFNQQLSARISTEIQGFNNLNEVLFLLNALSVNLGDWNTIDLYI